MGVEDRSREIGRASAAAHAPASRCAERTETTLKSPPSTDSPICCNSSTNPESTETKVRGTVRYRARDRISRKTGDGEAHPHDTVFGRGAGKTRAVLVIGKGCVLGTRPTVVLQVGHEADRPTGRKTHGPALPRSPRWAWSPALPSNKRNVSPHSLFFPTSDGPYPLRAGCSSPGSPLPDFNRSSPHRLSSVRSPYRPEHPDSGFNSPTSQHNRRPCNRSTSLKNTPCHGFHDKSR